MIVLTGLYPLLETLGPVPQWGRYHHLIRGINDLTSPMGRELITDMSHLVVISTCALLPNGSDEELERGVRYVCVGVLLRDDVKESV